MHIIIDDREKTPWEFMDYDHSYARLKEGDYTIKELLDYEKEHDTKTIRIERKSSANELAGNLGKHFKRFEAELQRLEPYEHKYLLFEFPKSDVVNFPFSCLPHKVIYRTFKSGYKVRRIKMNGPFMLQRLEYIENTYSIKIIYADNRDKAKQTALEILESTYATYFPSK